MQFFLDIMGRKDKMIKINVLPNKNMYFQIEREEPATHLLQKIGRNAQITDIGMYELHIINALRIVVACKGSS